MEHNQQMEVLMESRKQHQKMLDDHDSKLKEQETKFKKEEETNIRWEMERAAYIIRFQNIPKGKRETREELLKVLGKILADYLQTQEEEIRKRNRSNLQSGECINQKRKTTKRN